ncbi:MAG: hypothetical protein ACOX6K_08210 [Sphaerochaetaceae bacterium]|jgi:hypothetical protein
MAVGIGIGGHGAITEQACSNGKAMNVINYIEYNNLFDFAVGYGKKRNV